MLSLIIRVFIAALSFWIVAQLLPGWKIKNFRTACVVAVVYGLLSWLAIALKIVSYIAAIPLLILLPPMLVWAEERGWVTRGLKPHRDEIIHPERAAPEPAEQA